jgi:hypothetical protein
MMPSSSLQLALIALWVEKPSIPWLNPTWQSLTGIAGVPWDYDSDDNLEARAPNVKEWTVSQAKAVKEFMAHCKETPGTVGRHSHRPDDTHAEGRAIWNMWIKEQWFKTWKVNIMIDHMFNQEGCCPYTVLARRAITDPAQVGEHDTISISGNYHADRYPSASDSECSTSRHCSFEEAGTCNVRERCIHLRRLHHSFLPLLHLLGIGTATQILWPNRPSYWNYFPHHIYMAYFVASDVRLSAACEQNAWEAALMP